MKKSRLLYVLTLFIMLSFLGGCKDNVGFLGMEGALQLTVGLSDKVTVVSRSLTSNDEAELEKNCKIRIYSGGTLVRKYQGVENIPATIPLSGGNYSVRVTAGDSVSASFEKRFFEGVKSFVIGGGEETEVNVNCGIVNTVIAHTWDESLKDVFEGVYQVKVVSANDSLVFSSEKPDARGYFSLPESDRKLTFKFSATKKGGEKYELVKKLESARVSTLYNLTWKCNPEGQATGGAMLTVTADETPLDERTITIALPQRPVVVCRDIEGTDYDLEQPVYMAVGTKESYSLVISTSSPLKSALLQNNRFKEFGVPVNNIDIMNLDGKETELNAAGITLFSPDPEIISEKGGGTWSIEFSDNLIQKMTAEEGEVYTTLTVTDENNKQRIVNWKIIVSNATVQTENILPYEVWTSRAMLRGIVSTELKDKAQFRYRVKGSDSWIVVDAVLTDSEFCKEIIGLTPGTTYEYQAMDGAQASPTSCEFTTDIEFQPENAGFEYTSGDFPILIYGNGQSMWWDTGNHGSATMDTNVTTPDLSIYHSGNQSILLSSQKVGIEILGNKVGKFAAGNLFVGKYLKTDGTDGVLGWGRPCISRPKALKVWVRYEPGTVDNGGSHIANGATDQGIIYIAVGDWTGQESEGETWPFIVKTKDASSLFSTDKDTYSGNGIIAYGEKVFTEAYSDGGNLKELTIELDYDNFGGYERKPSSIIIVASASKFGDYFEGAEGSKMWLDDMELIYE